MCREFSLFHENNDGNESALCNEALCNYQDSCREATSYNYESFHPLEICSAFTDPHRKRLRIKGYERSVYLRKEQLLQRLSAPCLLYSQTGCGMTNTCSNCCLPDTAKIFAWFLEVLFPHYLHYLVWQSAVRMLLHCFWCRGWFRGAWTASFCAV